MKVSIILFDQDKMSIMLAYMGITGQNVITRRYNVSK